MLKNQLAKKKKSSSKYLFFSFILPYKTVPKSIKSGTEFVYLGSLLTWDQCWVSYFQKVINYSY